MEDSGIAKVGLLRMRIAETGPEPDAYIAFANKELGERYLKLQDLVSHCRLISYEDLVSQGHPVDTNKGTVVFETKEQIGKSLSDKTKQYLRSLVQ